MRFDDTKGTWAPFVSDFMRSRSMAGKFAYSEYFDTNLDALNRWATSPPMSSRSLVTDFALHFALQAACDGGNARALQGAGYAARNPFLSCTFVENPDTDTSFGEAIVSSKLLAYAFLLTTEGYPFVYGKDYFPSSVWPGAYGLKPGIDNLFWIHETLASGGTVTQFLDDKVIVLKRTGGPGLLTALNFDTFNARTITCPTTFGPNVHLHDYAGHHGDIWTDAVGRANFTIPSNAFQNGQSYFCFSRAGDSRPIQASKRSTTQTFFGAADLDIPPAHDGELEVGQIWCAASSAIDADLSFHPAHAAWPAQARVTFDILNSTGTAVASKTFSKPSAGSLHLRASAHGWHTLRLTSTSLPAAGSEFELTATYTGTQGLPA